MLKPISVFLKLHAPVAFMKEKETGSGHMKATASNLFLLLRCSASDHPLAWLIDGQMHCNAVWRRRHIVTLRRQRT